MSKQIQLTKGYRAIVDDEDYDWLIKYSWHANTTASRRTCYAQATIDGKNIMMHRMILQHHGLLKNSRQVDHIDSAGLNNQKDNLRDCTHAENQMNRRGPFNNGYKGIYRSQSRKNPWVARIRVNGKLIYLGYFPTPEAAARAYDVAAIQHHGEFARPNFPSVGKRNAGMST